MDTSRLSVHDKCRKKYIKVKSIISKEILVQPSISTLADLSVSPTDLTDQQTSSRLNDLFHNGCEYIKNSYRYQFRLNKI